MQLMQNKCFNKRVLLRLLLSTTGAEADTPTSVLNNFTSVAKQSDYGNMRCTRVFWAHLAKSNSVKE